MTVPCVNAGAGFGSACWQWRALSVISEHTRTCQQALPGLPCHSSLPTATHRGLAPCASGKKWVFRVPLWRTTEGVKGKAEECHTWCTNPCYLKNISWRHSHSMRQLRMKPDLWLLWSHLFVLEQAGPLVESPSCHILKLTSASYQSYQGYWDRLIIAGPHSIPQHLWYKVHGSRRNPH